jgi:pimeloyl-ACP methyl ester carboxylesterase
MFSTRGPAAFLDEHGAVLAGSVSEKSRVDVNGVPQGMFVRGRDVTNPVLLFVHGGPGMPTYFLTRRYPVEIEDLVTVVWWELWRGRFFSRSFGLWEQEVISRDLTREVPRLEVPTYLLAGAHDYTCVTSLARAYHEALEAPVKGFYLFEHSAHSPLLEEPQRARRILRDDVLRGTNALADAR